MEMQGEVFLASAAAMFCCGRGCLAKSTSQPAGRAFIGTERNFVMIAVKDLSHQGVHDLGDGSW